MRPYSGRNQRGIETNRFPLVIERNLKGSTGDIARRLTRLQPQFSVSVLTISAVIVRIMNCFRAVALRTSSKKTVIR